MQGIGEETVLGQIATSVAARLEKRKFQVPERVLRDRCRSARVPQPFREAFLAPGIHVISEVKYASPSEGVFSAAHGLPPGEAAGDYLRNGARALSILTEPDYFQGRLSYLEQVRAGFPQALLLMKDFIVDEYQLLEARLSGADAILLIMALLGKSRAAGLLGKARELGLSVLVEVHDERELEDASEIGADLIGVNNRNLKTLGVALETSLRLARLSPGGAVLISESGIRTPEDLRTLREAGFSGFLVGSALMRTGKPGLALRRLLGPLELEPL